MRTKLPETKPKLQSRLNLGTLVQRELQDTQFRPVTGWMSLSWHTTIPARTGSCRVTPSVHQWARQPCMRQSQAPLATREGTCPPCSAPELLHSQMAVTGRCCSRCNQAPHPCTLLLTALPMSTSVQRTNNLHAAAHSKDVTVLGRDGHILPRAQGDALIAGCSLPTLSSPSGSVPHLTPWWDQGQHNPWQMPVLQPELSPCSEGWRAPCPRSSLVRAQVPNAIRKKKNEVIAQ